jgi:hypothetical protein
VAERDPADVRDLLGRLRALVEEVERGLDGNAPSP